MAESTEAATESTPAPEPRSSRSIAAAAATSYASAAQSSIAASKSASITAKASSQSAWRDFDLHQHVQLQQLRLGEWLGHLLLAAEQPRVRRRRAWVAVLVLRPRHRLQRLRRRCASFIFPSVTAVAPTTASIASAAAQPASETAATLLVAEPAEAAPASTLAAETAAFAALAPASAAAVPLPTWRSWRVHEHVHVQLLLVLHPVVRLLLLLEPEQRLLRRRRPRGAVLVLRSRHRLQRLRRRRAHCVSAALASA
mgnify:FL=1